MRKASAAAKMRLSPKPLIDNNFRVTAIAQPLEPLRKIRNLIIFRKNHAQMRNNSISSCCLPVPVLHFSVLNSFVPIPCPSFPSSRFLSRITVTPAVATQFLRTWAAMVTQRQ
jgi:hypothetical protein